MTTYAFEPILLIDAANPTSRAASASVTVYDASDTNNTTPLALTDLNGIALNNPLTSTADAFTPAFLSPSSQVKVVGGGLTVTAWSGQGLLDEATAAKEWVQGIGVGEVTPVPAGGAASVTIDSSGKFAFALPSPSPLVEDPADPGTFTYSSGLSEDSTDPGTFLIGA